MGEVRLEVVHIGCGVWLRLGSKRAVKWSMKYIDLLQNGYPLFPSGISFVVLQITDGAFWHCQ